MYAYGLNLINEVFGFFNGGPQYVVQREYYHPTYAGEFAGTFGANSQKKWISCQTSVFSQNSKTHAF